MDSQFEKIAELFGMPESTKSEAGSKEGRSASESQELGRASLSEGDYEGAIKHFRRALEQQDEGSATTRVDLAGAYEYAEMAPQALRQYERALATQRTAPEPHLGMSQLYKRYARYQDSIESLRKAIELEPENAFYRFKLAEIFREIGEYERAMLAAQGAVVASPQEAFYHYWLGDLLIEMRLYEDALESLRAAIELSPGDDFLYLRAAIAFWGAGKQQEAVKAIRLASDLDPEKHLYHGVLEVFLRNMGMSEEAVLEQSRATKMDSYDRDQLRRLQTELGIDAY